MIKDYRFVPIEKQEPIEEEDDFDEELLLTRYQKKTSGKNKVKLYMAS